MTAPALGLLGLVLSLVVPNALARARWPARMPRPAVVLWQCVTLASVLSAVGVVLAAPEQLVRAIGSGRGIAVWVLIGTVAVAACIVIRLLLSLFDVTRRSRARRARHRLLVDLLDRAEQHGELDLVVPGTQLRVLAGAVPFAYCLPGRSPRVVLSGGTLKLLDQQQVSAILAHEQAHLRARHDVVTEAFSALYRALPRTLRSRTSLDAVRLLLEMLADDAARRRFGTEPLRAALTTMGGVMGETPTSDVPTSAMPTSATPTSAMPTSAMSMSARSMNAGAGTDGRDAEAERRARLERLDPDSPQSRRPSAVLRAGVYALAASILVLPTVILVVPWLTRALTDWPLS